MKKLAWNSTFKKWRSWHPAPLLHGKQMEWNLFHLFLTMETVRDFISLGSKITADGNSSHEIKRCFLLGRKAVTNLLLLLLLSRFNCVWLSATPWTSAYQALPSMGFSRQEYWSGVPLPSQDSTCRWYYMIFLFLWLTSLSMIISRSIHVLQGALFHSFFMAD